jgi:signal transduction histidine kinase
MVSRPARPAGTTDTDPARRTDVSTDRRARVWDAVLALGVFSVVVFVVPVEPGGDLTTRALPAVPLGELVAVAVASAALRWRRSRPLVALAVAMGVMVLSRVIGWSELDGLITFVALYNVGRHAGDDRRSGGGLAAVLVLIVVNTRLDRAPLSETALGIVLASLVWYVGRRRRLREVDARRREQQLAADAQRAVIKERTRIARELHDVVAHRVSLMTVQAGAAKTVAAADPASAVQAMQAVEQAGRQALDELRHLLGVLRPDADGDALDPQPGLADVPRLVERFRAAGLDVELDIEEEAGAEGAHVELPARIDLSAYRIVQESLTNVLKHAGTGARAKVRVRTGPRGTSIDVRDNGQGATALAGTGHGIIGMRERALLLGGRLEAGPRPGGGFRVTALLPVREERT